MCSELMVAVMLCVIIVGLVVKMKDKTINFLRLFGNSNMYPSLKPKILEWVKDNIENIASELCNEDFDTEEEYLIYIEEDWLDDSDNFNIVLIAYLIENANLSNDIIKDLLHEGTFNSGTYGDWRLKVKKDWNIKFYGE